MEQVGSAEESIAPLTGRKKESMKLNRYSRTLVTGMGIASVLLYSSAAYADYMRVPVTSEEVQTNLDFVWICLAAMLVFFMKAGFSMVEIGFTRGKNAVNAIMKNVMDFAVSSIAFWAFGFGLMFGATNGLFGIDGFFLHSYAQTQDPWLYSFWMYQLVFVSSVAAIVSGAMAERTRFVASLMFTTALAVFIYPVFGSWVWGGLHDGSGWLENLGFIDFAGSTVIHAVGGWAGLAGTLVLGPRIGKFRADGSAAPIPGHNLPLAALGTLILWFGWYGFNAGNTLSGNETIAQILINTTLAGAGGAIAGMTTACFRFGKADAGITLNGALAGLVAITAGCAHVEPIWAIVIGVLAGIIVVHSIIFFDKMGIDDPVGAISVHGVCGFWGTLAVGIFKSGEMFQLRNILIQLLGSVVAFIWAFFVSYFVFKVISFIVTLRVSEEDELRGLDLSEHANEAYPDFQIWHNK
ncbi:MAG: ammonium transporter [Kiritimatiellia bacterium]|jgi:Amt family ammonium transporter|nr:ammonium transporter [Kiritimatiellia bacterium]